MNRHILSVVSILATLTVIQAEPLYYTFEGNITLFADGTPTSFNEGTMQEFNIGDHIKYTMLIDFDQPGDIGSLCYDKTVPYSNNGDMINIDYGSVSLVGEGLFLDFPNNPDLSEYMAVSTALTSRVYDTNPNTIDILTNEVILQVYDRNSLFHSLVLSDYGTGTSNFQIGSQFAAYERAGTPWKTIQSHLTLTAISSSSNSNEIPSTSVPEPNSLSLILSGLLMISCLNIKRKQS